MYNPTPSRNFLRAYILGKILENIHCSVFAETEQCIFFQIFPVCMHVENLEMVCFHPYFSINKHWSVSKNYSFILRIYLNRHFFDVIRLPNNMYLEKSTREDTPFWDFQRANILGKIYTALPLQRQSSVCFSKYVYARKKS